MARPNHHLLPLAATAALALSLGGAALVCAQPAPAPLSGPTGFDPAQLPETGGIVTRYTLTPRGEVDGFLLRDGAQVHVPPHLSTQLVYAVRSGDAVTVRGLHAPGVPMVAAVSVANDAGGPPIIDAGGGPRGARRPMEIQGRVQTPLRGPRGEVNGAVLEDGTMLRLPLDTIVEADEIGPSADRLTEVGAPPRPPLRDNRGPRPPRG